MELKGFRTVLVRICVYNEESGSRSGVINAVAMLPGASLAHQAHYPQVLGAWVTFNPEHSSDITGTTGGPSSQPVCPCCMQGCMQTGPVLHQEYEVSIP